MTETMMSEIKKSINLKVMVVADQYAPFNMTMKDS